MSATTREWIGYATPSRCGSKGNTSPRRTWPARCSGSSPTTRAPCSTRCARACAPALLDDLRHEVGDLGARGELHLVRDLRGNVQHVAGPELRFGTAADGRAAHFSRRRSLRVVDGAAIDHRD